MKLAVNYSPQAAALLEQGAIEFDLYKCTEWPEMIAAAERQRPAYTHFPLMAGRHDLERVGRPRIAEILSSTATPYVNTHLAPRASDFDVPLDVDEPEQTERLVEAMRQDIDLLAQHFGRETVIVENANWDPNYEIPRPVILPEIITRVVRETGCGLLLDLAHARMSAAYFGMGDQAYISLLPLDRLRELHITGTLYEEHEARLVDHHPMTEADWALAEWALAQIHAGKWSRPQIIALEYGGTGPQFAPRSRLDVLATDVPRLYELVNFS